MMFEIFVYFVIGFLAAMIYRMNQEGENDINRHVYRNQYVLALLFAWPLVFMTAALAGIVYVISGERLFTFETGWDQARRQIEQDRKERS